MSNLIFKLDLLEHHYLQKKARLNKTKAILKSKKTHKLIPLDLEKDQAIQQINGVKSDIFDNKLHGALSKYQRELKKLIKSFKPSKKLDDNEVNFLKGLDIERISKIKTIKLLSKIYNPNLIEKQKQDHQFLTEWVLNGLTDKTNELSPSLFYNSLSNEEKNWYSKLMNNKNFKQLNETIESSFRLINGPVDKKNKSDKENLKKEEKNLTSISRDESNSENDDSESDEEDVQTEQAEEFNDDDFESKFAEYDNLVAGSDDEDDDAVKINQDIDYNEVTDIEASEDEEETEEIDDFFEDTSKPVKESKKEKKDKKEKKKDKSEKDYNLPKLMDGYLSGSDNDLPERDEVIEKLTKPVKKNRRGQRERQRIWELKYGGGANHVKKEKEEKAKQREQKQREFEERQRKRELKAASGTGFNSTPLGQRKQRSYGDSSIPTPAPVASAPKPAVHPSWEAKLKQKEALKNVKFEGKKVTFD